MSRDGSGPRGRPARQLLGRSAPSLTWRAAAFGAVGLSGTAANLMLLTLLHGHFRWPLVPANVVGYGSGIVNNYLWNRVWTFHDTPRRDPLRQGAQFALVSIGGLVIQTTTLALAVHLGLHYLAGFVIATGIAFLWNFGVNHQLTFRRRSAPPA